MRLVPETYGFGALNCLASVRRAKCQGCSVQERIPLAEDLWQQNSSFPTHWWDDTRGKPNPRQHDLWPKKCKIAMRLDDRSRPAWVDSQLAMWYAKLRVPAEYVSTSIERHGAYCTVEAHVDHLEVRTCRKLCEDGRITVAVDALDLLVQRGCRVRSYLFYCVLKRCIANKDLVLGRRIHALTIKSGYEGDTFLATHLIGLYASQGKLEEAMRVFTKVSKPDAYNWATIIFANAKHGEAAEAIRLYRQMLESRVQPDNRIHVAVLKACASAGDLVAGKEVHSRILASPGQPDSFVQTGLIDMYAKCKSLVDARRIFDALPERNVVTWNALLAGYSQQGMGQEALRLYGIMQRECIMPPDSVTLLCLLQACASVGVGALHQGKQFHAQIEERGLQADVALGGSLVNMYAKCGSLGDARSVFDSLPDRSVVTWNTMLTGYTQNGKGQEALTLYSSMQQEAFNPPSSVTLICLLQACASVGVEALLQGKQLHAQIIKKGLQGDVVLGTSLIDMYSKCGSLEDAHSVFAGLPAKNLVTWTAIIAGYARQGMGQEAITLYSTMQHGGISPPDSVTFVCLLQACAIVAALPLGKKLHAQIEERGLLADVGLGAALVNMYAKCGSMFDSRRVFDSLPEKTVEAWNALLGGYTRQGDGDVVFDLLDMMRLQGIQPNGITFVCVLAACSHVGLVDKGRMYFDGMRTDYGISPTVEHYTCMMDLLGRAGRLDEALQMAKTLPFPPSSAVWCTVLGACQKWNDVEIGQQAFEGALGIDGNDAAPYVLMSNIYASRQMWEQVKEMQARRVKSGAWKNPGQSWWTDMGGVVHTFVVGDKKHPESEGIYARLEQLVPKMSLRSIAAMPRTCLFLLHGWS